MSLIRLKDVSKTYQMGDVSVTALKNISLDIDKGTFVSFVGPSGSGKTTLLNLIGCIDKPGSGDITINDVHVGQLNRKEAAYFRGKTLGFIFQNFNLIPVLTVYENVEYPLIMVQNVSRAVRRGRVLEFLENVGMLDQKDKYPNQISGGQKQRVSVARALAAKAEVVLADEPTANLDHDNAFKVLDLMRKMKNDFNTTFIFSTHDPKIVGEAEIIYTLEDGAIVDKKVQTARRMN
jgi:putative ABC transport system ATP-binding protein